jgi:plasmid rolling circle replication initiator protein Rep
MRESPPIYCIATYIKTGELFVTVRSAVSSVPNPDDSRKGILLSKASKKDKPWDIHRAEADKIAQLYKMLARNNSLYERMNLCSFWLGFGLKPNLDTGEVLLHLRKANFCRLKFCTICQWRKCLRWIARFIQRVNSLDLGNIRWLHLTLTVRNVPIDDLRETIDEMNKAWQRLIQRKGWPAMGFIRSTEVTREDGNGYAHPHFHCLLLVPSSYFGRNYIPKKDWIDLWTEALRADYSPSVWIQAVKKKMGENLRFLAVEVLKYAVKPSDLVGAGTMEDAIWLDKLTEQTRNLRFVSTGGILKNLLKEDREKNDDLIHISGENDDKEKKDLVDWWFKWIKKHYRKMSR